MFNNNSFSSSENMTLLLNNLLSYNKSTSPSKYINKLLSDFANLLKETNCYDMEIKVGVEDNIKTFKAHSIILKARSSYFKAALSNDWTRKCRDGSIFLFEKENISPKIFEVLLM